MKAFLMAAAACIVISVAAGYILTGLETGSDSSRTASSVRLD